MDRETINGVDMDTYTGILDTKLHLVDTSLAFDAFFDLLMKQKLVMCDTETSGFRYFKDDHMVGASFGWEKTHFYVPFRHEASLLGGPVLRQLNWDDIKDRIQQFFNQQDVFTVWHNYKFDAHFYRRDGVIIRTPFHDTRILWHLFDESAPGRLKGIASGWVDDMGRKHKGIVHPDAASKEGEIGRWRASEASTRRSALTLLIKEKAEELSSEPMYQGYTKTQLKKHLRLSVYQDHEYADATKDSIHYGLIPIPLMCEYAGLDTFLTGMVYKYCIKNVEWTPKLKKLYINELKLSKALIDIEEAGLVIDAEHLTAAGHRFTAEEEDLTKKILTNLGDPDLNLGSNQQLAAALISHGVRLTKQTSAGRYSVDKGVLEKLSGDYPIVADLLRLRLIKKLRNTYVESILDKLVGNNILHCSFNQNVSTGRMSSSDPNLQNIPGADDTIRAAFIPPDDDHFYVFIDYSQIEVRLTAHLSEDPLLLDAYAKDQDIHTRTMCEVFGEFYNQAEEILGDKDHPRHKELKMLRTITKRINFGIIYGVGAPGLSEQIDKDKAGFTDLSQKDWIAQCQKYIDSYLSKYLGVKRFINKGSREVKKNARVTNSFGRVRHLPHARATKIFRDKQYYWLEGRAERQGVNFLVQGEAADLFKIAVVRVHELLKGKRSKIVNLVHDEIQLYMHKSELHLLHDIKAAMEDFTDYIVPIIADYDWAPTNWAAKQEIKDVESFVAEHSIPAGS